MCQVAFLTLCLGHGSQFSCVQNKFGAHLYFDTLATISQLVDSQSMMLRLSGWQDLPCITNPLWNLSRNRVPSFIMIIIIIFGCHEAQLLKDYRYRAIAACFSREWALVSLTVHGWQALLDWPRSCLPTFLHENIVCRTRVL